MHVRCGARADSKSIRVLAVEAETPYCRARTRVGKRVGGLFVEFANGHWDDWTDDVKRAVSTYAQSTPGPVLFMGSFRGGLLVSRETYLGGAARWLRNMIRRPYCGESLAVRRARERLAHRAGQGRTAYGSRAVDR